MKTQRLGTVAAVGALLSAAATAAPVRAADAPIHEFSANIALTTNYLFRGVSQTNDGPAVQGGFDYEFTPVGLYAGVWASNVDSGSGRSVFVDNAFAPTMRLSPDDPAAEELVLRDAGYDGASMELDLYVGWRPNWQALGIDGLDALSVDIGYLRYQYPNSGDDANNTNEWHIALSYDVMGMVTPSYSAHYSDDFFGADSAWYHSFGLEVPLPYDFTLHGSYGLTRYNNSAAKGGGESYDDYSAGVSYSYGGFDFDLSWVGRNKQNQCAAPFRCGDTAVFTISKTF